MRKDTRGMFISGFCVKRSLSQVQKNPYVVLYVRVYCVNNFFIQIIIRTATVYTNSVGTDFQPGIETTLEYKLLHSMTIDILADSL